MNMKTTMLACVALVMTSSAVLGVELSPPATGDLARDFKNPPECTKPRCYWYWYCGNISREGITHDLEAMKRVGIGEAYIGIIYGGGELKALTEWRTDAYPSSLTTRCLIKMSLHAPYFIARNIPSFLKLLHFL